MKTRNLIITLSVAALATMNVFATEALLSPRAADQPKTISGLNNDPNLTATGLPSASPRLLDNQAKAAASETQDASTLTCQHHMAGTPKMVGQCAEHPGAPMSCCTGSVAETK